ncbi:MAG: hypothetical protein VX278_09975 [Myxococcota bacterium]|nr:hypothetical protein [Myxococcota bacterium]
MKQIQRVQADPQRWTLCREISDLTLQHDCILSAVPLIAESNIKQASRICQRLSHQRAECFFQLAEISQQSIFCDYTESFQLDCKLHLLSKGLQQGKSAAALMKELQLPPDTPKAWTAIYRYQLHQQKPLDLSWCQSQSFPDVCTLAAIGTYEDRLNRARDRYGYPCNNTQAPSSLAYVENPQIQMLIQQREDQCP